MGLSVGLKMTNLLISQVKNAKPGKYYDGSGLALVVTNTSKKWVLRATINGKRRDWGLGAANDIGLVDVREKAADYRKLIREGIDPAEERKRVQAEARELELAQSRIDNMPTFKDVSLMVSSVNAPTWKNDKDGKRWLSSMERHVFPIIGDIPIDKIGRAEVSDVLGGIWLEIPHTAKKIKQRIQSVLDYAYMKEWRDRDIPMRAIVRALPKQKNKEKHFTAMPWQDVPAFIANITDTLSTSEAVLRMIEFTILTASRSGEVRLARWEEFDLKKATWTRPEEHTKTSTENRVPLSPRAIELLGKPGKGLVFPGTKSERPYSDMSMNRVLDRAGFEVVMHGFRSSFKDWCMDATNIPNEVSEACLAHKIKDRTEAAYSRTDLFDKRRDVMAQWADFCHGADNVAVLEVVK